MGRWAAPPGLVLRRRLRQNRLLVAVLVGLLACVAAVSSSTATASERRISVDDVLTAPGPRAGASCSKTIGVGTSLAAAIASARPGSVVCLGSGDYGNLTLISLTKTLDVTVHPAATAAVTIGQVTLDHVRHLRFTGIGGKMTIQGGELDPSGPCSSNVTIDHVAFSNGLNVTARCGGMNILIDHDTFDNLGIDTWEGRLNVVAGGSHNSRRVGVTISNSRFSGGCSDGIDVVGPPGVQIGPGNEFTGIQQDGCDPVHADPVQCATAPHLLLTGNYFHDNGDGSGGLMCGNGEHDITISNNVFACTCDYPYSIYAGGDYNLTITHNTFAGGGLVRFEVDDGKVPAHNLVRDNVFTVGGGISLDSGSRSYGFNDHNLNAGEPGVADIRGVPVFVGGAKPTSYSGYGLAPSSRGKGRAVGGSDMGIRGRG
jgi:hypothetical protein